MRRPDFGVKLISSHTIIVLKKTDRGPRSRVILLFLFIIMKKVLLILALALLSSQAKALDYDDDGVSPGYRGFVDFSYSLGVGDFGKNHDRVNLMTSHGYQFVPQFFAGIGIGANYYYDDEAWNCHGCPDGGKAQGLCIRRCRYQRSGIYHNKTD